MALYVFRCGSCGDFERFRPMGEATSGAACPVCGEQARRAFTVPGVRSSSPAARAAIERAEATSETPDVVSAVPPAAPPRQRFDPRTGFAPRPTAPQRDRRYQPLPTS